MRPCGARVPMPKPNGGWQFPSFDAFAGVGAHFRNVVPQRRHAGIDALKSHDALPDRLRPSPSGGRTQRGR
eukprot:2963644-Prymnesium_polylepis.1